MNQDLLRLKKSYDNYKTEKEKKKKLKLLKKAKDKKQKLNEGKNMKNREIALDAMKIGCKLEEATAEQIVEAFQTSLEKFEAKDKATIVEAFGKLDNPSIDDAELTEELAVIKDACKILFEAEDVNGKKEEPVKTEKVEVPDHGLTEDELAEAIAAKQAEKRTLAEDANILKELEDAMVSEMELVEAISDEIIQLDLDYSKLVEDELEDISSIFESAQAIFEDEAKLVEHFEKVVTAQETLVTRNALTEKVSKKLPLALRKKVVNLKLAARKKTKMNLSKTNIDKNAAKFKDLKQKRKESKIPFGKKI